MSVLPRSVGVLAARHREDALEAARRAVVFLEGRGLGVVLEPHTAAELGMAEHAGDHLGTEILVVLGGDGTVTSALRDAGLRGTPVIGVNFGTFGFLTEIPAHDLLAGLDRIAAGYYDIESRVMLRVELEPGDGSGADGVAANDVVVKASDPTHVLEFTIRADGDTIAEFPADGLIVATPTGSTAYSLSAGGPVVVPDLPAMVLTPICPHTLATRPLVLSADMVVTIETAAVGGSRRGRVSLDGRINYDLIPGAVLTVRRAEQRLRLARLRQSFFFDSLRDKLRWGKPK